MTYAVSCFLSLPRMILLKDSNRDSSTNAIEALRETLKYQYGGRINNKRFAL